MYEIRNFAIFSASEIEKINFSQIFETSVDTLRYSINKSKTFVKWDGNQPSFVSTLSTLEGPYTYSEMLDILLTPEWNDPQSEGLN